MRSIFGIVNSETLCRHFKPCLLIDACTDQAIRFANLFMVPLAALRLFQFTRPVVLIHQHLRVFQPAVDEAPSGIVVVATENMLLLPAGMDGQRPFATQNLLPDSFYCTTLLRC